MKPKRTKSINQINFTAILLAGLFAFISACLVVINEYVEFQHEIKMVEQTYIQAQNKSASETLNLLQNIIQYRYERSKSLSKEEIYSLMVEDIHAVMKKNDEESYFFIQHSSGKIFYASTPSSTQKNDKDSVITRTYEPLDLIFGCGVLNDRIEDVLAQKKSAYDVKIINFILKIYMLTLFLYLFGIIEYRYVSDVITRQIYFIAHSFKRASEDYEFINTKQIKFKEFKEIITHANVMIGVIKDKNSALVDLNSNLEQMVEKKTEELKHSVALTQELLEKEDCFVKNAIHEINTPLSVILMNIDLYNLKYEKNPYLLKIEAAVKVLDNIYEDLAYVVKKDRVTYTKTMINFSKFLNERVEYFADVAEGNRLSFVCDIAPDIFIVFNEIELQRICDNNLSNAIKYSYENQFLHVKLFYDEQRVVFEVENCGEVIKAPDKLFNRYYRENEVRGGFGLGLNIVKEICDANGVEIDVSSDEIKTRFSYRFQKDDE